MIEQSASDIYLGKYVDYKGFPIQPHREIRILKNTETLGFILHIVTGNCYSWLRIIISKDRVLFLTCILRMLFYYRSEGQSRHAGQVTSAIPIMT